MTNYHQTANLNATNSELDAKVIITYDATNSPKDWHDFWYNSETGTQSVVNAERSCHNDIVNTQEDH